MSESCVYLKIYNTNDYPQLAEVDRSEVMRYAGMFKAGYAEGVDKDDLEAMTGIMEECISEVMPVLTYKVSFRRDSLVWEDGLPQLLFDIKGSHNICTNLADCDETVMFAATIGIGIDRLISRYNHSTPTKALFMQAIGAERIEALCDLFNDEIRAEAIAAGRLTNRRYSPGYGDLPLETQRDFVNLLDCSRRIGVTLNESLLMSPSKSVTAIIGIKPDVNCKYQAVDIAAGADHYNKCDGCGNTGCQYRERSVY